MTNHPSRDAVMFWTAFATACAANGLTEDLNRVVGTGWKLTVEEIDELLRAGELSPMHEHAVNVNNAMRAQLEKCGRIMGLSEDDAKILGLEGAAKTADIIRRRT